MESNTQEPQKEYNKTSLWIGASAIIVLGILMIVSTARNTEQSATAIQAEQYGNMWESNEHSQ